MKSLSSLLLVSLTIGVATPLVARPRVPVAAWPGVSDVLLNVNVAAPAAEVAWPWDSEEPGSVIVFPKFRTGFEHGDVVSTVPRTRFAISVVCPEGDEAYCASNPTITMKAQWVCPGDNSGIAGAGVCKESDFHLTATINGTVTFGTDDQTSSSGDVLAAPLCERGYLIVWVVDNKISENPIKFDGLIGHSVHNGELGDWTYLGIPIQAADAIVSTGDPTAADVGGALAFDDSHYRAITGTVFGSIRYQQTEGVRVTPTYDTDLIFLTLDVVSGSLNEPTYVALDFYNEKEEGPISVTPHFTCWSEERRIEDLNEELDYDFGFAGFVRGRATAQDLTTPRTLIAVVETREETTIFGDNTKYAYTLFNNSAPVQTTFVPATAVVH